MVGRVYGSDAAIECMCQKFFIIFHSEDFNINDVPCFDHLTEIDLYNVKAIVDINSSQTVRTIFNIKNFLCQPGHLSDDLCQHFDNTLVRACFNTLKSSITIDSFIKVAFCFEVCYTFVKILKSYLKY